MMNIDGLEISILLPAFVAGLVVLLTHIPLGREVIKRGVIFIDLAIAQIAGLGVIIAIQFGGEIHGLKVQFAAVVSALLGAWIIYYFEKKADKYLHLEAVIGVCFILAASASILLLAHNPHGGKHLQELLVGQILWVGWGQIIEAGVLSIAIILIWYNYRDRIGRVGFYVVFAIAITLSVQLIGVYLVFASLIIPALATAKLEIRQAMIVAAIIGVLGYFFGLIASALFDLPSGTVIVWSLAVVALFTSLFMSRQLFKT